MLCQVLQAETPSPPLPTSLQGPCLPVPSAKSDKSPFLSRVPLWIGERPQCSTPAGAAGSHTPVRLAFVPRPRQCAGVHAARGSLACALQGMAQLVLVSGWDSVASQALGQPQRLSTPWLWDSLQGSGSPAHTQREQTPWESQPHLHQGCCPLSHQGCLMANTPFPFRNITDTPVFVLKTCRFLLKTRSMAPLRESATRRARLAPGRFSLCP